jgi:hypothetical protein
MKEASEVAGRRQGELHVNGKDQTKPQALA